MSTTTISIKFINSFSWITRTISMMFSFTTIWHFIIKTSYFVIRIKSSRHIFVQLYKGGDEQLRQILEQIGLMLVLPEIGFNYIYKKEMVNEEHLCDYCIYIVERYGYCLDMYIYVAWTIEYRMIRRYLLYYLFRERRVIGKFFFLFFLICFCFFWFCVLYLCIHLCSNMFQLDIAHVHYTFWWWLSSDRSFDRSMDLPIHFERLIEALISPASTPAPLESTMFPLLLASPVV